MGVGLIGVKKLYKGYDRKIRKILSKAETIEEVDKIADEYLKKLDRSTMGIKVGVYGIGIGIMTYSALRNELQNVVGTDLPYIPQADKAGHFAKGGITSMIIGKIHDLYVKYIDRPRPEDADDEMKKRKKPDTMATRVLAEGAGTTLSAIGWEYAQKNIEEFPGSDFCWWDALADMCGHIFNVFIDGIYYSPKLYVLCDAVLDRKEELGVYEDRVELSIKDAPLKNRKVRRKLRVSKNNY